MIFSRETQVDFLHNNAATAQKKWVEANSYGWKDTRSEQSVYTAMEQVVAILCRIIKWNNQSIRGD